MKISRVLPLLVLALPLAAALGLPTTCASDCAVAASSLGYLIPANVIASGTSITWSSSDIGHITRDLTTGGANACFEVLSTPGSPSQPVRFDVLDGALKATVDGVTTTCTTAVGVDGTFAVTFFCTIHPTMRGALVVSGA